MCHKRNTVISLYFALRTKLFNNLRHFYVVKWSRDHYIFLMKTLAILILTISLPTFSWAGISQTYYKGISSGLSGYELKTALAEKISIGHIDKGYGALISVYFKSDADRSYDNDGSLVDIYSENPSSYDNYKYSSKKQVCGNYRGESNCFNREHIFPQSGFGKGKPMKTDFFHVFPTDGYVNGKRSNHPFGEVARPTWVSQNGSKLGANTIGKFRGTVFEPIDEFKGDIARALLYFATRYENRITGFRHKMLNGTRDQVYADWFIAMLLRWHKMDPVSPHETQRNNIGYHFQGNRNPFIDHPEYVEKIWASL